MPKRRRSFKRTRRVGRSFKRRRMVRKRIGQRKVSRGQRLSTSLIRQPTGLPDRVFVKLKLHVDVVWNNTAGAYSEFQIYANSAFDPLGSTGTSQGYMWDQWAGMYIRYRVHGFGYRINPSFGATGITSTSVSELSICPSRLTTAFSTARQIAEQPRARTIRWQVNSGRAPTLKGFFRIHPILGITKAQHKADPQYQALTTADPATLCVFHMGTVDPVLGADRQNTAQCFFTQYVEFFDRAIVSTT